MRDTSSTIDMAMANDPKRKAKSNDVGWKYGFWPDLTNKDLVQCTLCGKKMHSGIKRLKQHLAGNYGDVAKCPKTTTSIMKEMHEALVLKKKNKVVRDLDDNDDDDVEEVPNDDSSNSSLASNAASNTIPRSGTTTKRKKAAFQFSKRQLKQQKLVASLLRKTPEELHNGRPSQTSIESRLRMPEEKESVHTHIANFFYECGIPFNAANTKSYEMMVEAIGQYGPGLKPPSFHELRVPLLEESKTETDQLRHRHEVSWKQYGCTLILDGWTNKRGRHFINFLVNSPEGTFFLDTVDASNVCHDAELLSKLLDEKIGEIGTENVVQVVTDNDSNYKAAGHILIRKRPTLFWTPCAARCLNLMLEDIGHLKDFRTTITSAKKITTFIYRHGPLLNAMLEKTNGRDLVRPAVTRFATAFLTMQSLYKHKHALQYLFVSEDWSKSKLSTTQAGKQVCDLVLSTKFWNQIEMCIRTLQPLLVVLRIVDGDETPALPEVYAAMEVAKQKIKDLFDNKPRLYKKVVDIVERRWVTQMEQKLYGASLFLNPGKYFDLKEKQSDVAYKLREDFNDVLEKMVPDEALQDKISNLADVYDSSRENFAKEMAIRQRKTKNPLDWWSAFGGRSVELTKLAKRILGLCCSSSGCERNWSTFEFIHTKKRNRLEHQRLRDLIYVQYNRKIASRFQKRRELGRNFDPLALDEFDWDNEWINNDGEVVPCEDLTWNDIDRAVGASDAHEGRRLPRNAQRGGNVRITYSRRGASTSRDTTLIDCDSDEDATERDDSILPNDDEDVEDDYGERPPTPSNDSDVRGGNGDDLMLDDFA